MNINFFAEKKMYGNRLDQTRIKNRLKKADRMRTDYLHELEQQAFTLGTTSNYKPSYSFGESCHTSSPPSVNACCSNSCK